MLISRLGVLNPSLFAFVAHGPLIKSYMNFLWINAQTYHILHLIFRFVDSVSPPRAKITGEKLQLQSNQLVWVRGARTLHGQNSQKLRTCIS
jgi:hypothetical protein